MIIENIKYIIIATVISLLLGPIVVPELKKLKIDQTIRLDGPKSHLSKEGTPTMGGIIFIISTVISMVIFRVFSFEARVIIFSMLGFGLIGFLDDYLIVVKKNNEGLTPKQKFLAQILVAVILILCTSKNPSYRNFYIPFANNIVNIGAAYYPLMLFVILGTVNSVNLTDGLDGLSSSVSTIALIAFGISNLIFGNDEIKIMCFIISGSLIGFLRYNKYPAKVFMGDCGSLALGGAFSAIALTSGMTFFLLVYGIIFVVETLSVIIQVASFKLTGKRVFLMSPIHHHFEAKGWHETKVVIVFDIVTLIFGIIGVLSLM
jgi:phospho-N-acetylmuramoyl-pentapeptide-transferase